MRSNLIHQPVPKRLGQTWVHFLSRDISAFFKIYERDLGKRVFSATIMQHWSYAQLLNS